MTFCSTEIRLLLIDNYDSYTYNLYHLFTKVLNGISPTLVRADAFPTFKALTSALGNFDAIVISPGPGTPHSDSDFLPLPADTLRQRVIPVFGVCLGHQALCVAYGASVVQAPGGPVHGCLSTVQVDFAAKSLIWEGIPTNLKVVRYHSLVVDPSTLPSMLCPTAWTLDGSHSTLMAVQHSRFPLFGVQFHPESIATEYGERIAANFATLARKIKNSRAVPWLSMRECNFPRPHHFVRASMENSKPLLTDGLHVISHCIDDVDMDTLYIYSKLFDANEPSFWLDSSSSCASTSNMSRCSSPSLTSNMDEVQTSKGRFSVMGNSSGPRSELVTYYTADRYVRITSRASGHRVQRKRSCSIFQYLNEQLKRRYVTCPDDLPIEMNGGYVGFFGYELKKEVPGVSLNEHVSSLPDAWFIFADRIVIVDHETHRIHLVAVVADGDSAGKEALNAAQWFSSVEQKLLDPGLSDYGKFGLDSKKPLCFRMERSKKQYIKDINRCLREIVAGESYEICLTNRIRTTVSASCDMDPFAIYSALRKVNPAPYSAFLRLSEDIAVCCSSPERFVKISSDRGVESKPIKGTAKRGDSIEADQALRTQLATSVKDRSENLMIVDLVRNDLGHSCKAGSISVPRLMHVESFATVHQLVSTIRGKLATEKSCVDCIRAAYPMGSMTGAPKVRTLDIIDRVERSARGVYSGSIGYLSLCGAADMNVVIRTAVIRDRDIEIGVGGAIVALSDPDDEFEEILVKGSAVMQALSLSITGKSEYELVGVNESATS